MTAGVSRLRCFGGRPHLDTTSIPPEATYDTTSPVPALTCPDSQGRWGRWLLAGLYLWVKRRTGVPAASGPGSRPRDPTYPAFATWQPTGRDQGPAQRLLRTVATAGGGGGSR
jgi:hypothetical protein